MRTVPFHHHHRVPLLPGHRPGPSVFDSRYYSEYACVDLCVCTVWPLRGEKTSNADCFHPVT